MAAASILSTGSSSTTKTRFPGATIPLPAAITSVKPCSHEAVPVAHRQGSGRDDDPAVRRPAASTGQPSRQGMCRIERLGLAGNSGVVRVSMVHYNTLAEVDRLIGALDLALA